MLHGVYRSFDGKDSWRVKTLADARPKVFLGMEKDLV